MTLRPAAAVAALLGLMAVRFLMFASGSLGLEAAAGADDIDRIRLVSGLSNPPHVQRTVR